MIKHLQKFIDFHLALALVAIVGTAGSLYLEFARADIEFEALNASLYSVVRGNDSSEAKEGMLLSEEIDQLEMELDDLSL